MTNSADSYNTLFHVHLTEVMTLQHTGPIELKQEIYGNPSEEDGKRKKKKKDGVKGKTAQRCAN